MSKKHTVVRVDTNLVKKGYEMSRESIKVLKLTMQREGSSDALFVDGHCQLHGLVPAIKIFEVEAELQSKTLQTT